MREYTGPNRQATYITFVPGDPPRLAAIDNRAAFLWRLDRSEPAVLTWDEPPVWSEPLLAASPGGRWLVAGPSYLLRRWDLSVDPPVGPVSLHIESSLARFAGPADRLVVVYGFDGGGDPFGLGVWAIRVSRPEVGSPDRPVALPMAPDLAARLARMSSSDWRIQSALSDDGTQLAVAPRELPNNPLAREAFVWDVGTGKSPRRVEASGHPCALSFSPDGSRLVIDVGTIYVHDTATLEVVASWKAKYDSPRLAWSPDGKLLARTDNSTTVRVYDASTGRQVLAVGGKRGRLVCAAFSPDGLTLATGTHTGPIRVWDVG